MTISQNQLSQWDITGILHINWQQQNYWQIKRSLALWHYTQTGHSRSKPWHQLSSAKAFSQPSGLLESTTGEVLYIPRYHHIHIWSFRLGLTNNLQSIRKSVSNAPNKRYLVALILILKHNLSRNTFHKQNQLILAPTAPYRSIHEVDISLIRYYKIAIRNLTFGQAALA